MKTKIMNLFRMMEKSLRMEKSGEMGKSLKSLMQIFATYATYASAIFVGKESCKSTVRYALWSRISLIKPLLNPYLTLTRFRLCLGSAVSRFSLASLICLCMLTVGVGNVWGADTYKLTAVTSVFAGNKYVFVESGNALTGTISSSKLQSTTTFNTTGLSGSESYVWTLETAVGGYYLKNVSAGASGYLRNSSKANLALSTSDQDNNVWTFSFGVSTAEINVGERKLAETGSSTAEYKAYVDIPSGAGYSFTVYRLDLEVTETYTVTWMSNGSQVRKDTDVPSGTAKTPPTISPLPCGDKLMGWTDAAGGAYVHGTSNLYTGATISITGDVVLYAVFADEE